MKKIALLLITIALLAGVGIRIWYVNKDVDLPPIYTVQMGEEVAIEQDIFLDAFENMDGYTVTVNQAEILSYEDFLAKYHYTDKENDPLFEEDDSHYPEMVYDLHVTIKNKNHTEDPTEHSGINFIFYKLVGTNFSLQINSELYSVANPDLEAEMNDGFRLRPKTEMDFHLPFYFAPSSKMFAIQTEDILNDQVYLVVSLHPNVKRILID
ncbi:protein of unknown function [Evansella caseinilytica]|uniref:DUF5028 domain-containing protein n=1 Tax=Evansella caseinilytica TaxID=1503961 RepID=A0A1H3V0M7_9BACI|nr:DUF5028 domain-containing protein [Evansella caseinilytica]SDZ68263.1 protein of unknown function [Evansella caseinilytica]